MIAKETVAEVFEKTDIVAVIGEYVALKKKGRNYLALCPFHSEKTPSFTVSAEKKLWHCFGCGEGGSVISFLIKAEKISFQEAVEDLAEKFGINIKKEEIKKEEKDQTAKLYQISEEAAQFYEKILFSSPGEEGRRYLEERGIRPETCKKFRLGFAPEAWDSLLGEFTKKGVAPYLLEKVGLVIPKEKTGYYDRFRERIIFPIHDARNRVIGFGARAVKSNVEPKYINSPETEIYFKGKNLYALNLAKSSIQKQKSAVLVEGYMDVITAHEKGFDNTVGVLGTALTPYQAKVIANLCKEVFLGFDADEAGRMAAARGVEILKNEGVKVKVLKFAEKDPDEFLRKKGKDAFAQAVKNALPYLEYKMQSILSKYNLSSSEEKAEAVKEFLNVLAGEKDRVLRFEYVKKIANQLNLSEAVVLDELKRLADQNWQTPIRKERVFTKPALPSHIKAEETILRIILENRELRSKIKKYIAGGEFSDKNNQEIFEKAYSLPETEDSKFPLLLSENLPNEELKKIVSRILINDEIIDFEKTMADCIITIKNWQLAQRKKDLQIKIHTAQKAGLLEELKRLTEEFNFYDQQMRKKELA